MIRVKINFKEQVFDKDLITLGKSDADIVLQGEDTQNRHIIIEKSGSCYFVHNFSNDPFATLNGFPFGKKILRLNDKIQVGQDIIQFLEDSKEEELLEEEDAPYEEPEPEKPLETILFNTNWKLLTTVVFAFFTFATVAGSGVYFKASGRSTQEIIKVAAGVADISMALATAQSNHITPTKQDWSDPDFINQSILKVVSPHFAPQAILNSQGAFNNTPFFIRVYTNGDMSRFLVIAQPAPNLLQWLIHKMSIVVDSNAMEIRKISDLKALNRLLANPNPLDEANGEDISKLVKQGTLMTLPTLAGKKNNWGFTPPSNVENYIYNAPRYHPFAERILDRAIHLSQTTGNVDQVALLIQEIENLSYYQKAVLYSSKGKKTAQEAQKALSVFAPNTQFLIGYLEIDEGHISKIDLIEQEETVAYAEPQTPRIILTESPNEDYHPLLFKIQAASIIRQKALKVVSDKIYTLLEFQNRSSVDEFNEKMKTLLNEYEEIDKIQTAKLIESLKMIAREYAQTPFEEFMTYIQKSELEYLFSSSLEKTDAKTTEEKIYENFKNVEISKNLQELEINTRETVAILLLDQFPFPEKIIVYQKKLHNLVLNKIAELILFNPIENESENVNALDYLLHTVWVTDPAEAKYFKDQLQ